MKSLKKSDLCDLKNQLQSQSFRPLHIFINADIWRDIGEEYLITLYRLILKKDYKVTHQQVSDEGFLVWLDHPNLHYKFVELRYVK